MNLIEIFNPREALEIVLKEMLRVYVNLETLEPLYKYIKKEGKFPDSKMNWCHIIVLLKCFDQKPKDYFEYFKKEREMIDYFKELNSYEYFMFEYLTTGEPHESITPLLSLYPKQLIIQKVINMSSKL